MAPSNSHFSFVISPSLVCVRATALSNSSAVGFAAHLIDNTALECPVLLQTEDCGL